MNKCHDCPVPIPAGHAHIRTNSSFERIILCAPCAEDRGWIDLDRPMLLAVS